jgi:pimeloyl-ACP methyl ester carboxylesterase
VERITLDLRAGTFHALARAGDGRPLLFLHGFPDHPPTAESFLTELASLGHRVVAPWLRGYAPSPTRAPFELSTLVDDVLAMIERWSPHEPVDLVGHDWGAVLVYLACARAPSRIARAVTLAIPHPLAFLRRLAVPAQLRASWYMLLFQLPRAERIAAADDFRLIDRLWQRWSPAFRLSAVERAELHDTLRASMPAPIHYYRAAARATRLVAELRPPIATPVLQLHGADDGCVLPPPRDDRHRFAGAYERAVIPRAGHFLHLEHPVEIAARISRWLSA